MKGLLLKDWYMMKKYCRYYLFVSIGFITATHHRENDKYYTNEKIIPSILFHHIPILQQ